jgi:hypothetical protein
VLTLGFTHHTQKKKDGRYQRYLAKSRIGVSATITRYHYASLFVVVKLVTYLTSDNTQNGDYHQALPAGIFRPHFETSFHLSGGLPGFLP